jgi:hypothetical protein
VNRNPIEVGAGIHSICPALLRPGVEYDVSGVVWFGWCGMMRKGRKSRLLRRNCIRSALLAGLLMICSVASAETLVLPPDMLELFKAHHCDAVVDYNNSPQGLDKNVPFDYSGWPGSRHIIAWCTRDLKKPAADRKYVMVLSFEKTNEPLRKCPGEIANMLHIGGIRLTKPTLISTREYPLRFLDTGKLVERAEPFLTDVILNRNPVDGSLELFTCVDGRWARASESGD